MDRKTVYIGGRMRGIRYYNYDAFLRAQEKLQARGYNIINPHTEDLKAGFNVFDLPEDYDWDCFPPGFDFDACRKRCYEAVERADTIYLLDGWQQSAGATAEHAHARWCGKEIMYELEVVGGSAAPGTAPTGGAAALPIDSKARLEYPLFTGFLMYFPRSCAAVAHHSKIGNDQHNPGEPLHWAKEKSIGRGDQIVRHLMDGWMSWEHDREAAEEHFAGMVWRAHELHERFLAGMEPFNDEVRLER